MDVTSDASFDAGVAGGVWGLHRGGTASVCPCAPSAAADRRGDSTPLPPEAYKDPEQWAVEELVASVEANTDGAVEPAWANVPDDELGLE